MAAALFRFILIDIVLDALYFPVWWYTSGLIQFLLYLRSKVRYAIAVLGIGIWVKNFFKPMYGVTTWQERIISVVMRFFVLIGKCIGLLAWLLILFVLLAAWLVFLPAVILLFVTVQLAS